MALRIDHVCVGVANLYEGAARMRDDTGFESYDGGWFPQWGGAQKTIPLGRDNYLEINSVIDSQRADQNRFGRWVKTVVSRGDHLLGSALTCDTEDEVRAFADRVGMDVKRSWGRHRPDGRRNQALSVSGVDHAWPLGMPTITYFLNMDDHPARAYSAAHRVQPDGIAWLEVGDEEAMRRWVGEEIDNMPFRYIDRPAGLYAVGIRTADGNEVVIRRTAATWVHWERPSQHERAATTWVPRPS